MSTVILHLDAQQRLDLAALPSGLGVGAPGARELRYREHGGPAIGYPVDSGQVDWSGAQDAVSRLVKPAREAREILVLGRAPLPVFGWLGFQLQPWAGGRQRLVNRRPDGTWDVIDLSQPGSDLFDDVTLGEGEAAGLAAVFVSVMGGPVPTDAIRDFMRREALELAGIVTIRTTARTTLDERNGPGAAAQLKDLLSQVATRYPKQRGLVLFVAGPATLAFMAGRAANPNLFRALYLPNHAGGDYLPAIAYRATARAWRWAIFLAHAGPDQAAAMRLFELLDHPEHPVFLDSERLLPGDPWDQVIPQAQRDSRVTVVLISGRTERAWYEREEIAQAIALAREEGQRVVPVYLPGADRGAPPYGLRRLQALTVDDPADLAPVADRLRTLLDTLDARGEP